MVILEICIGAVLGFLTGLGIGGGSLLMVWLTQILKIPQAQARGMNLLFFLPSALLATALRLGKKELSLRPLFPGILAGCACAAVGTRLATILDTDLLQKLFGGLLLLAGVRELFYRETK